MLDIERVFFRKESVLLKSAGVVLALAASAVVPAALHADSARPAGPPWEKFGEDAGIAVFRRDVPGSPIIALRGEGIVNAPIGRVATVLTDSLRSPEWIDSLAEVKIIRTLSETERVEWDHVATPFVLKDRDFVVRTKIEFQAKEKQVLISYRSVTDPAAPKTDFVRGEFTHGSFVLTALEHGTKTRVLAELLCDPKGSVPKWIVNLFQKGWPHKTIQSLRTQVKKADITDHPKLKEALTQQGYFE